GGDAGRSQRELERGQLLAMLAHTLGEEHLLGHESDHVKLLEVTSWRPLDFEPVRDVDRAETKQCMVNSSIPDCQGTERAAVRAFRAPCTRVHRGPRLN